MQELLPAIRSIAGDVFVFQQDNAPAHRARDTVELLRRETPDFISPHMWPANSPDLNPMDYRIWGVNRVATAAGQHLESVVDDAIDQWRTRLEACVQADGGHFEQRL